MLCIFKQNNHYIKKVYDNFIGSDMDFEKFNNICNDVWKDKYGFLTINLKLKINEGKYMNKFSCINVIL